MQRSDLEKLSRKELQALAKENGVKANLSNADIISKLAEIAVDTSVSQESPASLMAESMDVAVEEAAVVEVAPVVEVSPVVEVVPVVEIAPFQPMTAPHSEAMEDVKVGDAVEIELGEIWVRATVKRVNKKTVRVCLVADAEEFTVKFTEIRAAASVEVIETASKTEEAFVEVTENSAVKTDVIQIEVLAPVEEATAVEIQQEAIVETENVEAEDTSAMIVEETETKSTGMEVLVAKEFVVNSEKEEIVAPMVEEAVLGVVETIQAPPTPVAALPQAPPTPVSAILPPPTPVAATRVSSIGWNFVLQDSAVKAGPANNRRKERRQARRSTMEQLAESMKKENLQAEADAEAEAEAVDMDMAMSSEESSAEENASEPVSETMEETVVESVNESVVQPVVEAAVEPATVEPEAAAVVVPTPAAFVASTPAAPAPVAAANVNKSEMLPRMNKAQIMRLGAIQKKIVTTDQVPIESAAFTAKAAVARPSPAMTPNHRSSICTSAPSSVLHQPGAPFRKAATPLSGRASMLTTGTKRKMSDLGCSSANSTAPDFKNMHKKQFSSLKSIAECVDQDKSVGVRMTIAMESAMTKAKSTPAVAAAPVAKAAANPFGKVVNKSAANTPSKAAAATPAHAQASRPGSVHTANNNVLASKNNGNGSSNIVKSRTVTSFVPGNAAPSSCGHNNLTSFVNNENSHSTHNASSATSFLKGKDSVGAGKHRTVMLTGGSTIRQQHLTML